MKLLKRALIGAGCLLMAEKAAMAQVAPKQPTSAPKEKVTQYMHSGRSGHLIEVMGGLGAPIGDFAKQYGRNGLVCAGYTFLTKSGYTLGLRAGMGFGNKLKYDPIGILRDANGGITAADGSYAEVTINQRIYLLPMLRLGKVMVLREKTSRSQWELALRPEVMAGYLRHKVRIEDLTKQVPLLDATRRRGFDNERAGLMGGLALSFWALNPRGRYALFVQAEGLVSRTKPTGAWDYNRGYKDTKTYSDGNFSLQVGLALTLFNLEEDEFFFY